MKEGSEAKLTGMTPSPHRCHAETTQLQNVPKQTGYTGDKLRVYGAFDGAVVKAAVSARTLLCLCFSPAISKCLMM